jgi:hypothetical protein
MHPVQDKLKKQASELTEKLAKGEKKQALGAMLWKYTDPAGNEFWLKEKKMTIRSPYTGKTFTAKPERETPSGVGQDLREEAKAPQGAGPGSKTQTKRRPAKKADWSVFAMEHSSPDERQKYLKEHPDADPSRHTVFKDETDEEHDARLKKSPDHPRARPEDFGPGGKHELKATWKV